MQLQLDNDRLTQENERLQKMKEQQAREAAIEEQRQGKASILGAAADRQSEAKASQGQASMAQSEEAA